MRKPRPQGINALPAHTREKLDAWLTGEIVTYEAIRERLREQFNVEVSISALAGYFKRLARRRVVAPSEQSPVVANMAGLEIVIQIEVGKPVRVDVCPLPTAAEAKPGMVPAASAYQGPTGN